MKFIILFLLSLTVNAQSLSEKLESKKYYFTALNEFFLETYNKDITEVTIERLERLLFFTGIELLEDYDQKLLEKYPTSSTRFILGRTYFQKKDFKKALETFSKVHPDHRYFPEAQLLKAQIFSAQKDYEKESETYFSCQKAAEKEESKASGEKIKRYYRMIFEICLVNKARRLFKEGKFRESIDAYDQIPKVSYKWPYVILEKAWAYYHLGDYNRTLGLLTTYKSPLLDSYFFPEAEYLASLTYFRLCLYEDSSIIISQYYQFYRPRFQSLENTLRANIKSQDYFYHMMFSSTKELENQQDFVKQIVTRIKKQTRFSLDFNTIHKVDREMELIKKYESPAAQKEFLSHLESIRENMVNKINFNAKTEIFNFLETVPFFSNELFKLNLEILSKKKDLIYNNKKLVSDRSRGDYSNVQRNRFEYFWKFDGAFWADELGDYSLGLKSNCEIMRKEKEGNQ